MIELLSDPQIWMAFLTLTALELVLGIDNIIFISILASKLPVEQQAKARNLGLTLAMVMRIGLVFAASWVISLKDDLFTLGSMGFSGRDLILIVGGGFLIYKAAHEIHEKMEGTEAGHGGGKAATATFGAILVQILLMDLVFSFDSVITAVGGGVLRDVIARETPELVRPGSELYAIPAMAGATAVAIAWELGAYEPALGAVIAVAVFGLRALALHRHWFAPRAPRRG